MDNNLLFHFDTLFEPFFLFVNSHLSILNCKNVCGYMNLLLINILHKRPRLLIYLFIAP